MLALMPRVLVRSHVPPGPAVESAFLHVGDVVGNQVVAQRVALVDGTPQLAGLGMDGNSTTRVADAIGKYLHIRTIGIEYQNVSAIFLRRGCVGIVDVGA